jgi:hypothetical protein
MLLTSIGIAFVMIVELTNYKVDLILISRLFQQKAQGGIIKRSSGIGKESQSSARR